MNNMTIKQYAGMLRNIMRNIEFLDFQIITIEDEAPAVSQIEYLVSYTIENVLKKKKIIQRLIYENDEGTPLVRGAS